MSSLVADPANSPSQDSSDIPGGSLGPHAIMPGDIAVITSAAVVLALLVFGALYYRQRRDQHRARAAGEVMAVEMGGGGEYDGCGEEDGPKTKEQAAVVVGWKEKETTRGTGDSAAQYVGSVTQPTSDAGPYHAV